MPWETIVNSLGIGGVTGIATVIIVVMLGIVQFLTTKGFEAELKRFESELKRAEQLQMSKLSLVTSFDTDLRARRITHMGPCGGRQVLYHTGHRIVKSRIMTCRF